MWPPCDAAVTAASGNISLMLFSINYRLLPEHIYANSRRYGADLPLSRAGHQNFRGCYLNLQIATA